MSLLITLSVLACPLRQKPSPGCAGRWSSSQVSLVSLVSWSLWDVYLPGNEQEAAPLRSETIV